MKKGKTTGRICIPATKRMLVVARMDQKDKYGTEMLPIFLNNKVECQ